MTTLLQEALTKVSTELNQHDQDRLARVILEYRGKLHDLVEDLVEELEFEKTVISVIESERIQGLLSKVADTYRAQYAG